jgi:hypothetical protein
MSAYFSYVDTVLRVIHINAHLKDSEENINKLSTVIDQLDRMRDYKTDLVRRNISRQLEDPELTSLYIHEAHHYWQTFFYPFLYYMCWQEYRIMMDGRRYLRYNKDYEQLPFQPDLLSDEELNTIQYTTKPFRLVWQAKRLHLDIVVSEMAITDPDVFCLVDLLEDTTTLFQFKCQQPNPGADSYSDWVNNPRNKGYKRLYKFIRAGLGKETAYRLLPVWVQLAFTTTEPISGFCNFVTLTLQYELTDLPVAELYEKLKDIYLSYYPVQYFAPARYRVIEETPATFFDEHLFRDTVDAGSVDPDYGHYPLALHGTKWLKLEHETPDFQYYLMDPAPDRLSFLLEHLYPYLTFFNFMDFEGRKNAVFIPPDYNEVEFIYHDRQIAYKDYLPEIFKKKEIVTSIFTNHNSFSPHNCHHLLCPYYDTQLCRRWNAIPRKPENCAFPLWFAKEFFYEIDLGRKSFQRIGREKIEQYKAAYDQLLTTTRRKIAIQYMQKKDNSFVLMVPRIVIEGGRVSYFTEFLALAAEDHNLAETDLYNKVNFDFPDYISDDRFLFEIPEIVGWFKALKNSMPHFFLYPNMDSENKQGFILFPMFISYQKYDDENGDSGVEFNPQEMLQFMAEECVVMDARCRDNHIDGEPFLLSFISYIKLIII